MLTIFWDVVQGVFGTCIMAVVITGDTIIKQAKTDKELIKIICPADKKGK